MAGSAMDVVSYVTWITPVHDTVAPPICRSYPAQLVGGDVPDGSGVVVLVGGGTVGYGGSVLSGVATTSGGSVVTVG